jgi:hypothetical protein
MKKFLLLGLAFLITPAFAADFQPDSSMCVQMIQHAVSPQGVCETFATPCDVPESWRVISSCDLVKPKESSTRFEDVSNRRKMARIKRMQELARQQAADRAEAATLKKSATQSRVGRAFYTKRRGSDNLRLGNTKTTSHFYNRKTTTLPDLNNTDAQERVREINKGVRPGLKTEGEMTEVQKFREKLTTTGSRRPGWITSTQMKRTGYLSMKSYYSQRSMKREMGPSRNWRVLHPLKRKKTIRTMDTISNRKGWRGPRFEGDLGGSLRD